MTQSAQPRLPHGGTPSFEGAPVELALVAVAAEQGGGAAITAPSTAHHLTLAGWTAALLAMSPTEVLVRSGGIALRARRLGRARCADALA